MSTTNHKELWVFAEIANGTPAPVYQELLCKARELADAMGNTSICSVVIGHDTEEMVKKVAESGTEKIYIAEHEKLARYNSENYAVVFEKLINNYNPEMILMGATALGSELAPTVAAKVKTGLAAHCIDIRLDGDRVNCMVPAFGGRVVSEIYIPDTKPMMASVRSGILCAKELPVKENIEIINTNTEFMDGFISREELVSFVPNVSTGKKLETAEVVVCVGRGAATEDAWKHTQELAENLDAAIGYTRSFADMGLVPDETDMIGTSGKSVKPKVFLGFGISGASQLVCGMNKSDLVISVNKDEKAKMFQFSDYGIVGDADKVLSALLKKLEK